MWAPAVVGIIVIIIIGTLAWVAAEGRSVYYTKAYSPKEGS